MIMKNQAHLKTCSTDKYEHKLNMEKKKSKQIWREKKSVFKLFLLHNISLILNTLIHNFYCHALLVRFQMIRDKQ